MNSIFFSIVAIFATYLAIRFFWLNKFVAILKEENNAIKQNQKTLEERVKNAEIHKQQTQNSIALSDDDLNKQLHQNGYLRKNNRL
ncbi:DUF2681 domain-containing protein [Pasteurella skyensis]|uniref:DUF2681 domain-containing protein n=1 Tax=Phocoenobacter skyensis TaxID=97481 RepID=A0AAJ6NBF6_9PAST|nr:DUF2681 domain-containing protein [Pasteurella skyensis]MDP8173682.1 DUF2681 domain-containing protein [Pasteurella skyensis]MDP8178050.1 DUF2681 domain-containing protein [Pasteurella skyensis]